MFAFAVISIAILQCYFFPAFFVNPEIWAETGGQYLAADIFANWREHLLGHHSGHLHLLPMAIANLGHYLLPAKYWLFFLQGATLLYISFCCAFPTLSLFEKWMPNRWVRYLISLLLCCVNNYEIHALNCVIYFGVIPFFLILTHPECVTQLRRPQRWGIIALLSILPLSKPLFLVFVPMLLAILWKAIQQENRRTFVLALCPLTSILIQFGVTLRWRDRVAPQSEVFGDRLWSSISMIFEAFLSTVAGALRWQVGTSITAVVCFCFFVLLARRATSDLRRQLVWVTILLVMHSIAFGSIAPKVYNLPWGVPVSRYVVEGRHWLGATSALMLVTLWLTFNLIGRSALWQAVAVVIATFSGTVFNPIEVLRLTSIPSLATAGHSNWEGHHRLALLKDACVPMNPFPLVISYGRCRKVPGFSTVADWAGGKIISADQNWLVPKATKKYKLLSVEILLEDYVPAADLRLDLYDSKGRWQGTANPFLPLNGRFVLFNLSQPVTDLASVRVVNGYSTPRTVLAKNGQEPIWIWMGIPQKR